MGTAFHTVQVPRSGTPGRGRRRRMRSSGLTPRVDDKGGAAARIEEVMCADPDPFWGRARPHREGDRFHGLTLFILDGTTTRAIAAG